jgi:cytoskeletal protein RodZ
MAQISRPFQVAFAAVVVLGLVWVVALHRPTSSSSGPKSASPASVATPTAAKAATPSGSSAAGGKSGGTSAGIYHGSAPGVEGLTRAIAKAHGAVTTSEQNARQLQEKSSQASSDGTTPSSPSATPSTAAPSSVTAAPASKSAPAAPAKKTTSTTPNLAPHSAVATLANQHLVEAELNRGRVVAVLFWSSKGSDDLAVRNALRRLKGSDHHLAVHIAAPGQVASFGSITRGVQVFGTPTILIVGKHGRTLVLTGLQDAYAIEQAVTEARHG